jgi:hypothetical protein
VPHVVVAFDKEAADMCRKYHIPFLRHDEELEAK